MCVCVCLCVCVCVYMFVGVCSWAVGFSICLWYVLVYPSRSGLSKVPFSVFLSVPVFSPKPPISSFSSVSREPEKVKPALIIHFAIYLLIFGPRTQNPDLHCLIVSVESKCCRLHFFHNTHMEKCSPMRGNCSV